MRGRGGREEIVPPIPISPYSHPFHRSIRLFVCFLVFLGVFWCFLQVFIYARFFVIKLLSLIISKLRYCLVKSLKKSLEY